MGEGGRDLLAVLVGVRGAVACVPRVSAMMDPDEARICGTIIGIALLGVLAAIMLLAAFA